MDSVRSQVPFFSALDNTGVIVITYLVVALSIYAISWLLSDASQFIYRTLHFYTCQLAEKSEAFDRRLLFDAQTRIKELSVECERLRQNVQTPTQIASFEHLKQRVAEQEALIQRLREQAIDPGLITQKEDTIARLQRANELQAASAETAAAELTRQQAAIDECKAQLVERDEK